MLIVMHHKAGTKQIEAVTRAIEAMGLTAAPIPGSERTAIGVLGNKGYVDDTTIRDLPGVSQVIHVSKPYKLVSRDFHPKNIFLGQDNQENRDTLFIAAIDFESSLVLPRAFDVGCFLAQ